MPEPAQSDFPPLAEPAPRARRRTTRNLLLRWAARGLVAALLALLVFQIVRNAGAPQPKAAARRTTTAARPPQAPPRSAWQGSIVAIESRGSLERKSHGCGFVVGPGGWIATNLHVMQGCTEAVVRLADGATYEIAGYAAVDFDHDLALLALKDAPELPLLALATRIPDEGNAVFAVGHPQGSEFTISAGKLTSMVPTSALPAGARQFAGELARDAIQTKWLEHTAPLAPGSSGGPLIDPQGNVVGINTWIDSRSGDGYAVDAAYLAGLLTHASREKIVPLIAHATAEAKLNHQLLMLSASRLRELVEQGSAMSWQPKSREQYRTLQQLAWAITVARLPDTLSARGALGDRLDELAREAEAAVAELRRQKWNDVGQITLLNEYAAAELPHPPAGLVFFASVERVVEGEDQERGIVVTLAGFEEQLFLPLQDQLVLPARGTQCLVLGVLQSSGQEQLPIVTPGAIVPLE